MVLLVPPVRPRPVGRVRYPKTPGRNLPGVSAGYLPLAMQHGEAFAEQVTVAGYDLTGPAPVVAKVRADQNGTSVLTLGVSVTPTGTTGGRVALSAPVADVESVPAGGWVWDLFVNPAGSAPLRLLAGPVNVCGTAGEPATTPDVPVAPGGVEDGGGP